MAKKRGSAKRAAKKARRGVFQGDEGAQVIGTDDDMLKELLALEVAGEIWAPDKRGDSISGAVKSIESRNTKYGWQMIFKLDTGTAGVYTCFMNSHLEREFQALCIIPGDLIGIMYKEMVPTQAGDMRLFAVVNKTQSADSLPERLEKRYDFVATERDRRAGRQRKDDDDVPF